MSRKIEQIESTLDNQVYSIIKNKCKERVLGLSKNRTLREPMFEFNDIMRDMKEGIDFITTFMVKY